MSDDIANLLQRAQTPAMRIDPHAVVLSGRRRHRRRVVLRVGSSAAAVAVLAVVAVGLGSGGPTTAPPVPGTSGPTPRTSTAATSSLRPPDAAAGSFAIDVPGVGDGSVKAGGHFWVSPARRQGEVTVLFQRYEWRGWTTSLDALTVPDGAVGAFRQAGGGTDPVFVVTHGKPTDLTPTRQTPSSSTDRWAVGTHALGQGDLWASILVLSNATTAEPTQVVRLTWKDPTGAAQHTETASAPAAVRPPHRPLAGGHTTATIGGMPGGTGTGPATFRVTTNLTHPDTAGVTITHIDSNATELGGGLVTLDPGTASMFVLPGEKIGSAVAFRYIYGLVRGTPTEIWLTADQPGQLATGWAVDSWPISGRDMTLLVITVPGLDAPGQVTQLTWTANGVDQAGSVVTPGG